MKPRCRKLTTDHTEDQDLGFSLPLLGVPLGGCAEAPHVVEAGVLPANNNHTTRNHNQNTTKPEKQEDKKNKNKIKNQKNKPIQDQNQNRT